MSTTRLLRPETFGPTHAMFSLKASPTGSIDDLDIRPAAVTKWCRMKVSARDTTNALRPIWPGVAPAMQTGHLLLLMVLCDS